MQEDQDAKNADPFIAWSCAHDYNGFSVEFRVACEKQIRKIHGAIITPEEPSPIDGIIIYDRLQRGLAVAVLTATHDTQLPRSGEGQSCDSHFDESELCDETNAQSFTAAVHAGSRGMLVRLGSDGAKRYILLDQYEVAQMHPMGKKENPDRAIAAVGLLAHELGHAGDYALGRKGLPSVADVAAATDPQRAPSIHTVINMALAEYIATRAECAGQVSLHGSCSDDLSRRASAMARKDPELLTLDNNEAADTQAHQQRQMDLTGLGYTVGTLAGYLNAKAPVRSEDGTSNGQTTTDRVKKGMRKGSLLADIVTHIAPALEQAAHSSEKSVKSNLVKAFDSAFISAQARQLERSKPKVRDPSLDDWFGGL